MGFCHSCGKFAPILNPGALCLSCFNLEKAGEISISSIEDQHRRLSRKLDPLSLNFLQDVNQQAHKEADRNSHLNSRADLFQNSAGSNQDSQDPGTNRSTRIPPNPNPNPPYFQNIFRTRQSNNPAGINRMQQRMNNYVTYRLSNLSIMLSLFSFLFLVEPYFAIPVDVVCLYLVYRARRREPHNWRQIFAVILIISFLVLEILAVIYADQLDEWFAINSEMLGI